MINQQVIPVLKCIKDVERASFYNVEYFILMDLHLSQLGHCCRMLKDLNKKVIIHLDLIKGLKSDEYAVDYLVHDLLVDGIISVKGSIIEKVKRLHKLSIQRMFLIDTQSYHKSIDLIRQSKPDYIELLPGCISKLVSRVKHELDIEVIAGGLIETLDEVHQALNSGATAITTSNVSIIEQFIK